MQTTGIVKDWHDLHNEECPQNNGNIAANCTCKQPRTYKPYRVVRMFDAEAPHGIDKRLVLHGWPNGVIQLREHGRRTIYSISAGELYKRLVWSAVLQAKAAKKKARRKK